jgi:HD-GYP domain-containing protein (c-di-GMP phosphodiesterase class II)
MRHKTRELLFMPKKNNVISLPDIVTNVTLLKLSHDIEELKNNQKKICEQAAKSMLRALDAKDHYTFGHSMRVAYYSLQLGQEIGLNDEELYQLEMAALFHDIGKIGVPDSVLLKPSRLEEHEFQEMKLHPSKSYEILSDFEIFSDVALYAKHHHERYDGRGYPDGLKGEDIPFFSRVILIGDTFDAMTSTRPYRKGLSYDIAFNELKEFAGTQFDPKLVDHFINAMKKDQAKKENTFSLSIIQGDFAKEAA